MDTAREILSPRVITPIICHTHSNVQISDGDLDLAGDRNLDAVPLVLAVTSSSIVAHAPVSSPSWAKAEERMNSQLLFRMTVGCILGAAPETG